MLQRMRIASQMAFCLIATFAFFLQCINIGAAQVAPLTDISYRAIGEIGVQYTSDEFISMMFEENYNSDLRQSVFSAKSAGLSTTIFQDMNLKQALKYDEILNNGEKRIGCNIFSPGEWINVHSPPDLELFEMQDDVVLFPLNQLLWGLSKDYIKPGSEVILKQHRNIPCNMTTYQLNYTSKDKSVDYVVEVEAYWSDSEWNTSSKRSDIPVGFVIHHNGVNKTGHKIKMDQYINIMYFTRNLFNKEEFAPRQGIYCSGRKSLKPFPQFENFAGLSISMEYIKAKDQLSSNVDIKIDRGNQLVQIQFDPLNERFDPLNPRNKESYVYIASYEQMVAYEKHGDACDVKPAKEEVYDEQTLYAIENLPKLTIATFFGRGVKYNYIGETIKRGIPCELWQGLRRGWPPSASSITTLWEWCFAESVGNPVIFQKGALPVISLDITVIESTLTEDAGGFTRGTKLSYNFYEIATKNQTYLRSVEFDISPCFSEQYKEWLQFEVKVPPSQKQAVKNATRDPDFIEAWRTAIYSLTGIQQYSLRVAKLKAIPTDTALLVQFILLDRHPEMPAYVEKDVNLKDSKNRLKLAIDTDSLNVDWKNMVLKAVKGSLKTPFEISKPTTTKPAEEITTEKTERITQSTQKVTPSVTTKRVTPSKNTPKIVTKPTDKVTPSLKPTSAGKTESEEPVTDAPKQRQRSTETRHTPGTMAGLGIGMLLVGFSIGAGGTFAKYRYFP